MKLDIRVTKFYHNRIYLFFLILSPFLCLTINSYAGDQGAETSKRLELLKTKHDQKIYNTILEEKEKLARKEEELNAREQRLKKIEEDIDYKMKKLENFKTSLQKFMDDVRNERSSEKEKNLKQLVKTIQSMKARDAAKLINSMEEDLVVDIFVRMKGANAGKVLAFIPPEKGAQISRRIANIKQKEK